MSKKERVLIVHNYYQIPGGEDTVVANEKKMLEDNGHKVFMYTRHNDEIKERGILGKLKLPFESIYSFKTKREVKKLIRENNIDIVHVHNTLSLVSPSVYYAALSCKVPIVQTIHNFRLICPGATLYRNGHICEDCIEKGLKCAVKNSCYRNSKLQTLICTINLSIHRFFNIYNKINYICLTEFNKEKLLSVNQINNNKVFIKPNFMKTKGDIIPYNKRKKQIVFAGRLDKLKGIDILLEAWKEVDSSLELIICGTGPMEEFCKDFIQKNKFSNIKMTGFIKNDEVKQIIANSIALVLPTQWYEGFPMAIVEAYAVGTPVIGSAIGNVNNLIIDGVTGIKFEYNKPSELAKAIKKINDMTYSTNKYYENNYTENINYKMLINIYKECK